MTNTHHSIVEQPDERERGSALIGVLLLLMMMSALAAALAMSGQTETLISSNQRAGAQAHVAAEAGLNHAVELATTFIFEWKTNGFGSTEEAVDALLLGPDLASGAGFDADNGSLAAGGARVGFTAGQDIPLGTRLTIAAGIPAQYEAFIMDDDPPPVGGGAAPDENGDALIDANERLLVRATGYGPNNSKVTLEAVISPFEMGALITNGDLEIIGSVDISGLEGDVHTNGDLDIGGSTSISGTVTASGEYTGGLAGTEGVPEIQVPEVHASDYLQYADFILTSDGRITNLAGGLICTAPCSNWTFSGSGGPDGDPQWSIGSGAPPDGTYYVEGAVSVTGSPGSAAAPIHLTLIAEGSIDIAGNPDFTADTTELLFVTDGDLEISGGLTFDEDPASTLNIGGQVLVHEQIKLSGNPYLLGQFIVENAPSVSGLVTTNEISGHVEIVYNGGLGGSTFAVTGWREIR